jgi:hypothetical protein
MKQRDRRKRRLQLARAIAQRCYAVDWPPPEWVRYLLQGPRKKRVG